MHNQFQGTQQVSNKLRITISAILLGVLISVAGGILAKRVLFKERKNVDLNFYEQVFYDAIHIRDNVKKIAADLNIIREAEIGKLPPKVPKDALPIEELNFTKELYFVYSKFDEKDNSIEVYLVDLQSHDTLFDWSLDYIALNTIHKEFIENSNIAKKLGKKYHKLNKKNLGPVCLLPENSFVTNLSLVSHSALIKVDRSAHVEWKSKEVVHHSIEYCNGYIWACGHDTLMGENILDDCILKFSLDGKLLFKRSISQIALSNPALGLSNTVGSNGASSDPYHLNDVQPVKTNSKKGYWKKGDVFLSLRHKNMIMLYRPENDSILWFRTHPWDAQHDVNVVDDSTISVFNNDYHFYDHLPKAEHSNCVFYHFDGDSTSTPFEDLYEEYEALSSTQGRAKYLKDKDIFYTEVTDRSYYLLQDTESGEVFKFYLPYFMDGYAAHLSWFKVYTREQLESMGYLKPEDKKTS